MRISCREAARLSSEGLDRRLTWRERLALYFHLRACVWCARMGDQLRFVHDAGRRPWAGLESGMEELHLPESARSRIRETLAREMGAI